MHSFFKIFVDNPCSTDSQQDGSESSVLTASTRITTVQEAPAGVKEYTKKKTTDATDNSPRQQQQQPAGGVRKTPSPPPRQISEDSGIEPDCFCLLEGEGADAATAATENTFLLVANMTAAAESESFLLCQPNWSPFLTHVRRTIAPLRADLEALLHSQRRQGRRDGWEEDPAAAAVGGGSREALLAHLAARVQRFCQDSLIAFPKSLATSGRSPRYQDSLKVAVENMVLQLLHTNHLWPLLTSCFREQDLLAK